MQHSHLLCVALILAPPMSIWAQRSQKVSGLLACSNLSCPLLDRPCGSDCFFGGQLKASGLSTHHIPTSCTRIQLQTIWYESCDHLQYGFGWWWHHLGPVFTTALYTVTLWDPLLLRSELFAMAARRLQIPAPHKLQDGVGPQ